MTHEVTTPFGLRIQFEDGYPDPETGKSKKRSYTVDGQVVPSVTTITGIFDKPGMCYAAEKLTVLGCMKLYDLEGDFRGDTGEALESLKSYGLRFYQQWDARAKLGTATHDDFVALASGQDVDESQMSDDQRAFCAGIRKWAAAYQPEVLDSEVMVASKLWGFAGRFDLLCRMPIGTKDVTAVSAKCRLDLKTQDAIPRNKDGTAKPPYPEHLFQIGAYEIAALESGYSGSHFQAILRVDAQGDYDFTVSLVEPHSFLALLNCYKALKGVSSTPAEREALAA